MARKKSSTAIRPTGAKITGSSASTRESINRTSISLVNSTDGREVPWQNGYAHILVGGEKLGRGYTVKGLTVTYMPRSPGGWTADTIQQRARFFGYHRDYLELCRVYLHSDVRDSYAAYVTHESDMRARLAEHRGRPLREWRRMFYLDSRLAPTRRNVLVSPWMRASLRDGWFAPHAPHLCPDEGRHNERLVSALDGLQYEPDDRHPDHRFAVVPLEDIFERVLMPLSYLHEDDALGLCVVNCNLKTLLESDANARCVIYQMNSGRERERNLTDGLIPQLFQGRSSAGAASYPGDRAFADRNVPTIQLHTIRVMDAGARLGIFLAVAVRLGDHEPLLVHDEH
jgi:Z1 domain